jgi:hypothetical protein
LFIKYLIEIITANAPRNQPKEMTTYERNARKDSCLNVSCMHIPVNNSNRIAKSI